jgi:hypothetical protein
LDLAWENIEERIEQAKKKVIGGEASPILYFMELKLMDLSVLSGYTGFWKWQIQRHMKPDIFRNLSNAKLLKYAEVFDVNINELKNFKEH